MSNNGLIRRLYRGALLKLKSAITNPYANLGLSWLKVKQIKHQSAGKLRTIRLIGHTFNYTSPNELIHGLEEIFIEKVYKQSFGSKPYIIDCGANIGLSIIYIKSIAPDAIIDAFEPDPENFSLLKRNVTSYRLNDVVLHQEAIWKEDTMLQFESDGLMSSKIGTDHLAGKKLVSVKAVRLKNFLNRKVDFLKMDIEGAEYDVIKDVQNSLASVRSMFIEYHGKFEQNSELLDMLSLLLNAGFQFYIKEATSVYDSPLTKERSYPGDWDVQLNIFFTRK